MTGETLVTGQNAPIETRSVGISVVPGNAASRLSLGLAVSGRPDLFWPGGDAPKPVYLSGGPLSVTLQLDMLGDLSVDVIVFTPYKGRFLNALGELSAEIAGRVIKVSGDALAVGCLIVAQLYRRNGIWKVRAVGQGIVDGVNEYARRHGVPIEVALEEPPAPSAVPSQPPRPGERADWSGSGCQVSPSHILTNAHVVAGASRIVVSSFEGRGVAVPVLVDEMNDIALVRVDATMPGGGVKLRIGGVMLGEEAVTLGYPLHGLLGSAPQFTSGSVSNLLGPDDDARVFQITAPIQPGSSGCPVFDGSGNVIGLATATLRDAQNVNFAVRAALGAALMEAAGVEVARRDRVPSIDMQSLVQQNSKHVWRLECFR
jgi:S1-C subfamily serine protease